MTFFGIQARDGCSCAGRYGHYLLDIDYDESKELEIAIANGDTLQKPGWIRINFNYFIDEATFEYLLSSIELIASHSASLLPEYGYDETSGGFRHVSDTSPVRSCLQTDDFYSASSVGKQSVNSSELAGYLCDAESVFLNASGHHNQSQKIISQES